MTVRWGRRARNGKILVSSMLHYRFPNAGLLIGGMVNGGMVDGGILNGGMVSGGILKGVTLHGRGLESRMIVREMLNDRLRRGRLLNGLTLNGGPLGARGPRFTNQGVVEESDSYRMVHVLPSMPWSTHLLQLVWHIIDTVNDSAHRFGGFLEYLSFIAFAFLGSIDRD